MTIEFVCGFSPPSPAASRSASNSRCVQRNAGLRTITLVASGACLFVTLGVLTGDEHGGMLRQIAAYGLRPVARRRDHARQGFHSGDQRRATLWCSAAVGVLCGAGHYGPALAGTLVVLLTNTVLREVSRTINADAGIERRPGPRICLDNHLPGSRRDSHSYRRFPTPCIRRRCRFSKPDERGLSKTAKNVDWCLTATLEDASQGSVEARTDGQPSRQLERGLYPASVGPPEKRSRRRVSVTRKSPICARIVSLDLQ